LIYGHKADNDFASLEKNLTKSLPDKAACDSGTLGQKATDDFAWAAFCLTFQWL